MKCTLTIEYVLKDIQDVIYCKSKILTIDPIVFVQHFYMGLQFLFRNMYKSKV